MNKPAIANVLTRLCRERKEIKGEKLLNKEGRPNQNALARLTGLKQPTIGRMLLGQAREPRDSTLEPLARLFGLSVDQFKNYGSVSNNQPLDNHISLMPPEIEELAVKLSKLPAHSLEAVRVIINGLHASGQLAQDELAYRLLTAKTDTPEHKALYDRIRRDMERRLARVNDPHRQPRKH